MKNNKNAPSNLGALFNKKDTIIASLMIVMIAFLWIVTTQFEKVPVLFSNTKNYTTELATKRRSDIAGGAKRYPNAWSLETFGLKAVSYRLGD